MSKTRSWSWLPLLLYCGLIFFLSSRPAPDFGADEFSGMDKVLHLGAYAVWALLCGWAVRWAFPGLTGWRFVLVVALAGTLYGISDELHQSFVPERTADVLDAVADAVGSLLGAAVFWRLGPKSAVADSRAAR